jgi:phosphopantothenoylcysteine decarboxylase/phosphopantothenate--cysteine ligase
MCGDGSSTGKTFAYCSAMDYDMWQHPATQNNVRILKSFGYTVIPPAEGVLASGLIGPGRLPDIPY